MSNYKQGYIEIPANPETGAPGFTLIPHTVSSAVNDQAKKQPLSQSLANIDKKMGALLFEQFNSSKDYQAGEIVTYEDEIYKFTKAHRGPWLFEDVQATNIYALLGMRIDSLDAEVDAQGVSNKEYVDGQVTRLTNLINATQGGISGFAPNTDYNPNIPVDKQATVIAGSQGTYTNFKDVNGKPITITEPVSFTIFFKAAGVTYWDYQNIPITLDIAQEFGDSTTKVVSQKVVTENFSNLTNFIDSDLIDYGENVVYEKGLVNDDGSIDTASPSFMHTNPITVNKGDVILLESNGGLPNNVSIILKVLNDKYQRIEESFYYKENKFGYIFESDCNIIVNVRDVVYLHIYKSGTLKAIIQKLQQKNKNNIIAYPYKGYYGIDGVYYEDEAFLSTKKIPIVSGNSYEIRADFISKFTEDGTFIERVIASKPNTIYTFEENVKFIAISNQVTIIDNVVFIRNTSELIQTLYNFDSDNTREIDVLKNSDLRNIISFTYSGYYRVDGEFVEDEAYLSTKKISIVSGNSYEIRADFISKFTEDGTFIERVIVSKPNTIYTFEENVKFIAISNQVTTIDNVVFIRNTSELIQTLYNFDSENTKKIDKINFDIKGQNKYIFVGGFPQIKELYLTNTSIKQVTWIRKNFNGTWQILFNVGISNQYNYQPNGVIPIYTDKDMSIIGGYVVIDWSLQDSALSTSEDNAIKPVSYSRSFSPIISYYITKDYTNNVGFENRFNIIENDLTKLSKNYERLEKRIGMALSWIDDDFIINQVGVKPRYDLLYDKAIELGFVFDIALIPSSTPDGQDGIVSLDAKIEEVRRFEEAGIAKFLMHPPHYGWYKHSSGDVKLDRVKTSVVKSLRCFSENHILSRYNILVYPGSSASNNDIRKAVTKYFDIAVDSGGQTLIIAQGNNPNFRDRYKLARYAPESRIAQGLTWQQIKDEVQTILDAGQWLILGGHMSAVPISDNLDGVSLNTANFYDFINWANQYCPIRNVEDVWQEKKSAWELK